MNMKFFLLVSTFITSLAAESTSSWSQENPESINSANSQADVDPEDRAEKRYMVLYLFSAVHQKKVFKDLEILDHQIPAIKSLYDRHQQRTAQISSLERSVKINEIPEPELAAERRKELQAELRAAWTKAYYKTIEEADEILLEHQVKRLRQIGVQQRLAKKHKNDKFGIFIELAKELDLTEAEEEKFLKTVNEKRANLEAELEDLYERIDKNIVKSLPLEAREKLRELVGRIYFLD